MLRTLGISDERARGSLRFGLGRFNTAEDVEYVIARGAETVARLRKLGSQEISSDSHFHIQGTGGEAGRTSGAVPSINTLMILSASWSSVVAVLGAVTKWVQMFVIIRFRP